MSLKRSDAPESDGDPGWSYLGYQAGDVTELDGGPPTKVFWSAIMLRSRMAVVVWGRAMLWRV